jgi:hypothetical protein
MKTVEVPVWLAVVVALGAPLITATGMVMAQLVNAWREKSREEDRWNRDRIAESARMMQEHSNQWREVRLRTYGQLIQSIRLIVTKIDGIRRSVAAGNVPNGDDLEELKSEHRTIIERSEEAKLAASAEVHSVIHNGMVQIHRGGILKEFLISHVSDDDEMRAPLIKRMYSESHQLWTFYNKIRSAVRDELGASTPQFSSLIEHNEVD